MRRAVAAVLLLGTAPVASAQTAPAVISGRVLDGETGEPLRRARVGPAASTSATEVRDILTDGDGHFALPLRDASSLELLTLTVAKAGHATQRIPPKSLAGAKGDALEIRLARGAAISGRVVRPAGVPAVGAPVVARRLDRGPDGTDPDSFDTNVDDLGEYRISGLPAGRYTVTAGAARPLGGSVTRQLVLATISGPSTTVEIRAGGERSGVDFAVDEPGPLSGLSTVRFVPAGRAAIRGRVRPRSVSALPSPARGAIRVTIDSLDRLVTLGTIGDSSGRFAFEGVPNGDYTLESDGDLKAQYGNRRDIGAGEVIRIRDESTAVSSGDPRDPAIAGVVVDDLGAPFQGARVQALEIRHIAGRRLAMRVGAEQVTDDHGRYRLFGLPPGSFLVSASMDASISSLAERPRGSVPVYYPGTTSIDGALAVQAEAGRDVDGIDVTLALDDAAHVSGVALDETGAPLAGSVRLIESHRSGGTALEPRVVRLREDGSFDLTGLVPGEYALHAIGDAHLGSPARFGAAYVSATAGEMPPLTIVASVGATLEGRLVVEGSVPEMPPVSIVSLPADPDLGPGGDAGDWGFVFSSDGTFYQTKLHGPTRLSLTKAPDGWYLKSVTVASLDITDTAFDFGSTAVTFRDAEIFLSRAAASIGGSIEGTPGGPAGDVFVIAFSTSRDKWFAGSRHVKSTRATGGTFEIGALPPGDYWVAAVEDADASQTSGDVPAADTLERLIPRAVKLTMAEGDRLTTALRAVR